MLQNGLVGLLVLAALLYVLKRFMPKQWRKRGGGAPAQEEGCGSGCGSCRGCPSQTAQQ